MDPVDEIIKEAEKYRSEEQYELALEKYTEAIASLYASRGEVFGILKRFENEKERLREWRTWSIQENTWGTICL